MELGIFEEQMSLLDQNRKGRWKEMRLEDSRVTGSQGRKGQGSISFYEDHLAC